MQKKILIDFDNTMGVPGCDIDDGLALLYLLGCYKHTNIEAICTTYGNSTIEIVHNNTLRLFDEWKIDFPLYRGAGREENPLSDAAHYMAQAAAKEPGTLTVLALGSLTNLKGAAAVDPQFFENLAGIYCMGGITRSLMVGNALMHELNFACDAAATNLVLGAACPVTVATAHNCLDAVFTVEDFAKTFGGSSGLSSICDTWITSLNKRYEVKEFVCWDVVAAAMILQPELFNRETMQVSLNERLFSVGYLETAAPGIKSASICIPSIKDARAFREEILAAWKKAADKLGA